MPRLPFYFLIIEQLHTYQNYLPQKQLPKVLDVLSFRWRIPWAEELDGLHP